MDFFVEDRRLRTTKLKTSISRSSILTAIMIAVLLAATPFAFWEFVRTGEVYLLSHRFVDDMVTRLYGPGRMRFILQPTIAIIFGARDGVKDARAGRPPFLSALVFLRAGRRELVRGALASVRDLVAVAILLDVVSQLLIFRMVHPAAALMLGPMLIAAPYGFSRAAANRIERWRSEVTRIAEAD
jgi:hypothetical protein